MPPVTTPKKKGTTVNEAIEKGEKVADVVKEFTPPEIDVMIDRGKQAAQIGGGIFGMLKSMFSKKKK